jgi:hypothetical protein
MRVEIETILERPRNSSVRYGPVERWRLLVLNASPGLFAWRTNKQMLVG